MLVELFWLSGTSSTVIIKHFEYASYFGLIWNKT